MAYLPIQDGSIFDENTDELLVTVEKINELSMTAELQWSFVPKIPVSGMWNNDRLEGQLLINGVP